MLKRDEHYISLKNIISFWHRNMQYTTHAWMQSDGMTWHGMAYK